MNSSKNLVIEACAGSGKTHRLIERLLTLLRDGAKPGEILAITFTHKAAAEIRERLLISLRQEAEHDKKMRLLLQRILLAKSNDDSLTIHTFHGWFMTLLRHRPWSTARYRMANLVEDEKSLFYDVWRQWLKKAEISPSQELHTVMTFLSPTSLKKMLSNFVAQTSAWRLFVSHGGKTSFTAVAVDDSQLLTAAGRFVAQARGSGVAFTKAKQAAEIIAGGECNDDSVVAIRKAFLTQKLSINANLIKNSTKCNYLHLVEKIAEEIKALLISQQEQESARFNHAALAVCAEFLTELDAVKAQRNLMSFDDLEYLAWQAVVEDNNISALTARLNRHYRHILIDEFQDTSPIQWHIVKRWLHDAHGSDNSPSVFIVGDVKQAIYGFRHGDARLLKQAGVFLSEHYETKIEKENTCRRSAPPILDLLNQTFDGYMEGFIAHTPATKNAALAGLVEWHSYDTGNRTKAPQRVRIRNPLFEERPTTEAWREKWAKTVATRVAEIINHRQIVADGGERPCRPCDVLILLPQMTHAALLKDALAAQNMACAATGGKTSFLDCFECADMVDLLAVLLSPKRDLPLARVLKSPLFALSDDALTIIAGINERLSQDTSLWDKLHTRAELAGADAQRAADLLGQWRQRAGYSVMPAHDFLATLYVEGDIAARYRAMTPAVLHNRIRQNLSAFLDLTLLVDGGRRPLLSQFYSDVSRRRHLPPEPTSAETENTIRLMTVHKAKGLQAAVVILADMDFTKRGGRGDSADIFVRWLPNSDFPHDFVICPRATPLACIKLKEEAKHKKVQECKNLLYVAMSRAQQALLMFSSSKPDEKGAQKVMEAMHILAASDNIKVLGDLPAVIAPAIKEKTAKSPILMTTKENIGTRDMQTQAMQRGEASHQLFALRLLGFSADEAANLANASDETQTAVENILPALDGLLKDSRERLVETDIADEGEIIRPDLIIVRDDCVWVVDYKTGTTDPSHYRKQLQRYQKATATLYPTLPIKAAILTASGELKEID